MAKSVVGLFDDIGRAHDVVRDLDAEGFDRRAISLIARDEEGRYETHIASDDEMLESSAAAEGAGVGAILGGLAGLVVGLGAITIPGLGPIIAAGPIVSTLVGAGLGAATGGILGALVDLGVPQDEAEYYAEGVRRGGVLVVAEVADDRAAAAAEIMERHAPVDVESRAEDWRKRGWTGFEEGRWSEQDDYSIYHASFRRHYENTLAGSPYAYDYYEPAYSYGYELATDERYVGQGWDEIEPEARRRWTAQHDGAWEEFKDIVRHAWEEVTGDQDEETEYMAYDEYQPYVDYETAYRRHYEETYVDTEYDYAYYLPAYQFGYIIAMDRRYHDRDWSDVEPDARQRWEREQSGSWEDFKDAVRHGWNEVRRRV